MPRPYRYVMSRFEVSTKELRVDENTYILDVNNRSIHQGIERGSSRSPWLKPSPKEVSTKELRGLVTHCCGYDCVRRSIHQGIESSAMSGKTLLNSSRSIHQGIERG